MKHQITFSGTHLLLIPLTEECIEPLRRLRNREENRVWFFDPTEITAEQQKEWFSRQQKAEGDYMFAVCSKQDPTLFLGAVALYHHDPKSSSFEIGRLLLDAKKVPFHGLGKELIAEACRVGFEQLGAKRLFAELFADNKPSFHCFAENGFVAIGQKEIRGKSVLVLERRAAQ